MAPSSRTMSARSSRVGAWATTTTRRPSGLSARTPGASTPSSFDAILPVPPVHHVGKGVSKGRVIREVLAEKAAQSAGRLAEESTGVGGGGVRAVFVDDSAAELLDPEVASVPGLTKVLFSRVLA